MIKPTNHATFSNGTTLLRDGKIKYSFAWKATATISTTDCEGNAIFRSQTETGMCHKRLTAEKALTKSSNFMIKCGYKLDTFFEVVELDA